MQAFLMDQQVTVVAFVSGFGRVVQPLQVLRVLNPEIRRYNRSELINS